jgi:hypothetical protein
MVICCDFQQACFKRGLICRLCKKSTPMFEFDMEHVSVCPEYRHYFHKQCVCGCARESVLPPHHVWFCAVVSPLAVTVPPALTGSSVPAAGTCRDRTLAVIAAHQGVEFELHSLLSLAHQRSCHQCLRLDRSCPPTKPSRLNPFKFDTYCTASLRYRLVMMDRCSKQDRTTS